MSGYRQRSASKQCSNSPNRRAATLPRSVNRGKSRSFTSCYSGFFVGSSHAFPSPYCGQLLLSQPAPSLNQLFQLPTGSLLVSQLIQQPADSLSRGPANSTTRQLPSCGPAGSTTSQLPLESAGSTISQISL